MKKFFILALISLIFLGLLSGCSPESPQSMCRVVTGVDIACQQEDVHIRRHYTDSQKMEYVLVYLRLLEPLGDPETDPEQMNADVYEITVELSDGDRKVYRQKDHRYFSANGRPWQRIDPEQAAGLYRLMGQLPSDSL